MAKTMRAARWHVAGRPLRLEKVAEPKMRAGAVKLRVLATFVSPSMSGFLSNPSAAYPLPAAPFIPGMSVLGVVEESDTAGIAPGARVYCDPYLAPPSEASPQVGAFMGYFGFAPEAAALLNDWPDGGFAEKMLAPAACVTPLGPAATADPAVLARVGHMGTSYEALRRAGFEAGRTVIVTGATGILGVSTVMVAAAMGASRIAVVGRRPDVLARIAGLWPRRVLAVDNPAKIRDVMPDADCLIDCASGGDPKILGAAIGALKIGGSAVLVGGGGKLSLEYGDLLIREIAVRGSLWFPRWVPRELFALIGSGCMDVACLKAQRFPLGKANEAMAAASSSKRPPGFEHVALVP